MASRRQFRRPLGERRYRKLFIVAVEGAKTEPQYFAMLNFGNAIIKVANLRRTELDRPLKEPGCATALLAKTGHEVSEPLCTSWWSGSWPHAAVDH
jgi:hypothetical protein